VAVLTAGRRRPARRRPSSLARRQTVAAWVLAAPFLVLFLTFTLGPVLASLGMSFTDMRSTDVRSPFAVEFVGFEQYADLLGNDLFRKVAWNTALYVLLGVPLTMAMGLAAALGLNSIHRLRGFFRAGYYIPAVTSIVAVAVVWRFLLRDDGILNTLLGYVGWDGRDWLNETSLALPSLVVMAAWRNFGVLMVIFLAGLQTIPREVTEAAEVDGAGRWQRFRHITLPLLRPTMLFAAVITGIGYLQFFEEPLVMTQGGPLDSTRSVTYLTFDQFSFGNYAYASAMSYLLFLAVVVLTAVQFRALRTRD
jgi:multiple sugar transport system permease protein